MKPRCGTYFFNSPKRNFNLVFLVEDKFINDKNIDFYLYINEYGAASGTLDEYKSVVKLDYVR